MNEQTKCPTCLRMVIKTTLRGAPMVIDAAKTKTVTLTGDWGFPKVEEVHEGHQIHPEDCR